MQKWKAVNDMMFSLEQFKPHNRGWEREKERETAPSLTVQRLRECETHPSAGLTNSHANTHLAVTLKSKGSKPSIIASKKKETQTEKAQKRHNRQSGERVDRSIWSPWAGATDKLCEHRRMGHKTRWQFGVVFSTSAHPVSVWVNMAALRLRHQQQLW